NMNLMKLTPPTPPASPQPPSAAAMAAAAAAADAAAAASAAASAVAVLGSEVILVEQTVADSLQFYTQQQHQQSYLSASGNSRPNLHRAISSPTFQPSTNGGLPYENQSLLTSQHHHNYHHSQQQHQQQQQQQQQHQQSLIQLPPSAPPIPPKPDPEYAADPTLRPPYSFSTLIYMALKSLKKSKMTLQEICDWIGAHFAFYGSSADQSWQSAVRYNLTLNRCFQRVPRRKDEAASRGGSGSAGSCGGYWRLNPDYTGQFELANAQQQQYQHHQVSPSSHGLLKRQRSTQPQHHHQLPPPPLHLFDSPLVNGGAGFHGNNNRRHHSHDEQTDESPLLSDHPAAAKLRRIQDESRFGNGRSVDADSGGRHDSSGHWVSMALSGGPVETRVRDPTLTAQPASTAAAAAAASAAAAAATAVSVAATTAAAAAASVAVSTLTASSVSLTPGKDSTAATAVSNVGADSLVALPGGIIGVGDLDEDERWLFEPDDDAVLADPTPALDMSNPDSLLDLTLHGMALPPPSWWLTNGSNHGGMGDQHQQHQNPA
uniref:Fork-head domain-containing protein n=2 Tax=Macrostomum lignano TaxID=282301 RepID=A0A1I8GW87_9PLAT